LAVSRPSTKICRPEHKWTPGLAGSVESDPHEPMQQRYRCRTDSHGRQAACNVPLRPSGHPVLDRASGPRRAEADELLELFREVSGAGTVDSAGRILGFGRYEYRYDSGHGGIAPLLAFAPGPSNHTIYLPTGFAERWPELLEKLGKHRNSKACLYLTRL